MTTQIIANDEIKSHLLKVLSGYCFREKKLEKRVTELEEQLREKK